VLVVDDDRGVHLAIQTVLEGCAVVSAFDGEQARSRLAVPEPLDVVLIDKNLPDCSGFALLDAVARHPDRPASILITGFPNLDSAVRAIELGMSDYVIKPFSTRELISKVHAAHRRAVLDRERSALEQRCREHELDTLRVANLQSALACSVDRVRRLWGAKGRDPELAEELARLQALCAWNAAARAPLAPAAESAGPEGACEGLCVLFIEPDDALRDGACRALRAAGYRALPHMGPTQGALPAHADVVLACHSLLPWLSGQAPDGVPTVVLTGPHDAAPLGATGVLGKPFGADALLAAVSRATGRAAAGASR
jgi:DNA-binding response OmpR family regulator